MKVITKSKDPEVDTFTCPKCKAIWRVKGEFDYDTWSKSYDGDNVCPNQCRGFFGFVIRGKIVD